MSGCVEDGNKTVLGLLTANKTKWTKNKNTHEQHWLYGHFVLGCNVCNVVLIVVLKYTINL